jgi:hypothetical protein
VAADCKHRESSYVQGEGHIQTAPTRDINGLAKAAVKVVLVSEGKGPDADVKNNNEREDLW